MHPRKIPVDVVEIESGSDDEVKSGAPSSSARKTTAVAGIISSGSAPSSIEDVDSRTFWKAGNYEVGPVSKFASSPDLLEHARVHPKFLHSNATSHKWAFGAIAELLDNSVDEVQNGATFVKVDKINIMKDNSPALLVQDDGGGMDPQGIRKCMSLGYSSKKSNTTIGQYGNGFKTSTMRLGADVIVFSRAVRAGKTTQSVGLLSYTFLRRTGQDNVIVPMLDFDISSHWPEPIIYDSEKDWSSNLNTILEWSPFSSKEELMQQFEDIGSHGTKIIIYNLWLNDEGIYELSFDDDDEDIRLRDEASADSMKTPNKKVAERRSHISYRLRYSLRAYASILYLRKFKNFKILLRGKPIEQYSIADDLKYSKVVTYKPQAAVASKDVSVETTIGFIKEAPSLGVSGFNVYHKNRLIRPYWKVTSDGTSKGYGVVGVLEANFIEPAHDKQDFERSSLYIRLENRLKQILWEYWKGHCHYVGHQTPGSNRSQKQGAASSQHSTQSRPVIVNGLSAASRQGSSHVMASLKSPVVSYEPVSLGGETNFVKKPVSLGVATNFLTADQIRDENIELYMRCESHKQKQAELKEKIRKAEAELEDTRKKSAQLASFLETMRKQKAF